MPDNQEVAEQIKTEDDGFNSYGKTDAEPEVKEDGTGGGEESLPEEEVKEDAGTEETDGEQKSEKTAMDRMLEMAGDDDGDGDKRKTEAEEKKPDGSEKAKTGTAFTKETVSNYLSIIDEIGLPEKPIIIGNNEVDLATYRSEYPQEFNAVVVMAGSIAERIVEQRTKEIEKQYIKAEDAASYEHQIGELSARVVDLTFWSAVNEAHPGARKIAGSNEFKEFADKLPAKTQKLLTSTNPADAIAVLDAFKESTDTAKAKEHDEKAKADKQKKDGLLGGGVRSSSTPHRTPVKPEQRGEADGFDDYAKEKAKRG